MANDKVKELASRIKARQTLGADVQVSERIAAAALVLQQAGATVSPRSRNPRSTAKTLGMIETYAGLADGAILYPWLGLRGLDLVPGEAVGGLDIDNEIVSALIGAGGNVATGDPAEKVDGLVGDAGSRDLATVTAGGRQIMIAKTGLTIFKETERVFFGSIEMGADTLITSIDALESRRDVAKTSTVASASNWFEYKAVADEERLKNGDSLFEAYSPARLIIDGAIPHATMLVESAALSSVVPPVPHYRPSIEKSLITSGILSDVQLETIIYAGQAHETYLESNPMNDNAATPRQGFLIGHGTGVGKGRCIAGIIRDNMNKGRRRHIWLSERHRHINDARRDWVALGGRADDIIDLADIAMNDDIPARNGILFVTYSLVRGGNKIRTRLSQILDWFGLINDGVIAFDEAQNLRNAVKHEKSTGGWRNENEVSLQGKVSLELQEQTPNSRVVYASATSASDIGSMGYAVRLGLWGKHTAFINHHDFFGKMNDGGLNALELVARDLKAFGLYLAASLSFDGVQYERLEYRLTDEERRIQDSLATIWSNLRNAINRASHSTHLKSRHSVGAVRSRDSYKDIYFHVAKARFFQALLSSFKARPVIESIRQDLRDGHCAIVQMTNTFEANADKAIDRSTTGDLADVEATPADILIDFLNDRFPVIMHQMGKVGGQNMLVPVRDAQGNFVVCPNAAAERDKLIAEAKALKMPEGPFEQLFSAFGSDAIAEVSGRSRRLVPGAKPGQRILEDRGAKASENDIHAFQSGSKNILIFSTAGAAGSSYHADRACGNRKLRRHYLLQAGFRADLAVQGLGRSHRSNQELTPEYILVQSDLWSDKRMISTVASGMQSLGAITRGQRQAASQELFVEEDNLESPLANDAWHGFLSALARDDVPNMTLEQFSHETCLPVYRINGGLATAIPGVRRFLNAMSGMRCDQQEAFGSAYKAFLNEARIDAVRKGKFDRGIETLTPESLIKLTEEVIYRCPRTGAATRLLTMLRSDKVEQMTYAEAFRLATRRKGSSRFVKSSLTNRVACLLFPNLPNYKAPDAKDEVLVVSPAGKKLRTREQVWKERWISISSLEVEELWKAELDEGLPEEETEFHIVTGTLLPIWSKLPRDSEAVYRMTTDDGEHILGRLVSKAFAEGLVRRISGTGMDPDEALSSIEQGNVATLDNGWRVEGYLPRRSDSIAQVEVIMPKNDINTHIGELTGYGIDVVHNSWNGELRFLLPRDKTKRDRCWRSIVKDRKIDEMAMIFN